MRRELGRWTVVLCALALVAACGDSGGDGGTDASGDGGGSDAAWSQVFELLPGALFSVAGTAADDVWTVGADYQDGKGPTVLHYDGTAWTRMDTGLTDGDLWWVHVFDGGPVMLAGTHGRVLRHDAGSFEVLETPASGDPDQKVFGVWGANPEDLWAVGGTFGSPASGFIWHYDGTTWTDMALPDDLPEVPDNFLKPWGRAADDVWFVGNFGVVVHWDGAALAAIDPGTTDSLFTINGRADGSLVSAVGGAGSATVVQLDDATGDFTEVTPEGALPGLFGVFHRGDTGYAVGLYGSILHHDGTAWAEVTTDLPSGDSLHGVWIDPDGGVWAVGGDLLGNLDDGAMIYFGETAPASTIEGG